MRIEDTDLERSEQKYADDILDSMKWLGLTWDEEPLYQSRRLDHYLSKAKELVAQGHAYYCTCTEADVEAMRNAAMQAGKKPMYDRRCRGKKEIPAGPWVIRCAVPLEGAVEWDDLIRGTIRIANDEVDDFVLVRSNGAPTYNLSVVVDDVEMRMSHVIRGEEHTTNTPKQIHLYRYFKYPVPRFGHLPVILAADKKKLSKRHGAVAASAYRGEGYLPEAMLNFLARLGWSHGDQEVFTVAELVQFFDFDHVQKAGAVFNSEKLLWLNGTHIRAADPKRLAGIVAQDFSAQFSPEGLAQLNTELGVKLVALLQPKVKLLKEMADLLAPLVASRVPSVDPTQLKWVKKPELKAPTQAAVAEAISSLSAKVGSAACLLDAGIDHQKVDEALREIGTKHGVKLGDLAEPMRLAVTGKLVSAGLFDLLAILPWETCRRRLEAVAGY